MRHSRFAALVGTACIACIASSCGSGSRAAPNDISVSDGIASGEPRICQTFQLHASWAEYYKSLAALKEHADYSVAGTVSEIIETARMTRGPVVQTFALNVSKVLWVKDTDHSVPERLTLRQTGGILDGVLYELDDDPLFRAQDEVIVFLKEYEPGEYKIVGGPTGRFSVVNGTVRSIVENGVRVPDGTTVDAFAQL